MKHDKQLHTENYRSIGLVMLLISILSLRQIDAQPAATFDGSTVFSTFKFVNSDGAVDRNYTANIGSAYNLGYINSMPCGLLAGLNIGLREAGASKEVYGTTTIWNFQYAEARLEIGYIYNRWKLKPFVLISPYYSSLLKASQAFNEQVFNIKSDDAVANYDYGLIATGGINVRLSDLISLYTSYNQIYGIKNIETTTGQQLYNRGFSVSLGIALTITKTSLK